MDMLIDYAMQFVGKPYKYGGNNPMQGGMDCSGYVCEIFRFAGVVGNKEDLTASGLYLKFEHTGTHGIRGPGVLAFFGPSLTNITHVAFMVDAYRILEAGGGDSSTDTIEEAAARNAMVRGRTLAYRGDLVGTLKPRYSTIGII